MRKLLQNFLIFLINIYRNLLSPLKIRSCRFHPTCSDYALQSIKQYGPIKGLIKASLRVIKCNPFCKGGYDPI